MKILFMLAVLFTISCGSDSYEGKEETIVCFDELGNEYIPTPETLDYKVQENCFIRKEG